MIDQMMIPLHAIVSSDQLEGHHVHAIRTVHLFFKKYLLKEEHQNSRHAHLLHDVLDMTIDLEDHYINLYGPDLVTESANRAAECEDDDDGGEEETHGHREYKDLGSFLSMEETALLIETTQVTDDQMSFCAGHKAFNNAVNASTIQRRTEQGSTYSKAKNLGW